MRLEWEQFRDRVDKATTNIAGDLQRLKDRLDEQGQVSPEEKAEMERIASRLEAIAADPENPDPQDPNPVPEPGTGEGGGETGGAGESGTEGGQPSIT